MSGCLGTSFTSAGSRFHPSRLWIGLLFCTELSSVLAIIIYTTKHHFELVHMLTTQHRNQITSFDCSHTKLRKVDDAGYFDVTQKWIPFNPFAVLLIWTVGRNRIIKVMNCWVQYWSLTHKIYVSIKGELLWWDTEGTPQQCLFRTSNSHDMVLWFPIISLWY